MGYSTTGAWPGVDVPSHRRCRNSIWRSIAILRSPTRTARAWARAIGSLNSAGSTLLASQPPATPGDLVFLD